MFRKKFTTISIITTLSGIIIALSFFLPFKSPLYPEKTFLWPLNLPKSLSGTLGEKRGRSFHNGIDIKTKGRNGCPVYTTSSGYLYRIISKERGYGNAIQIKHDNNYYSFYAHLQKFEDIRFGLNSLMRLLKVLYNSNKIDFRFYKSKNLFNRGDVIGFSGETGSGFPHLHFEFRKGNGTVNPMKFIPIKDNTKPVIDNIFLCVERGGTTVYEKRIRIKEGWGRLEPENNPIGVDIDGRVFFKVSCYDRVGAENRVAVYRIQLFEGEKKIYEIKFDYLKWSDYKYGPLIYDISKSSIDGDLTYTYFLCRRDGNNFSGIIGHGNGFIAVPKGKKKFRIVVKDYAGNSSEVELDLIRNLPGVKDTGCFTPIKRKRRYAISNKFREITLRIKPNTLYNDTLIRIADDSSDKIRKYLKDRFSIDGDDVLKIYSIYPFDIVYRKPVDISIKRPLRVTPSEAKEILIYSFFDGGYPKPLKTRYSIRGDILKAVTKTNGFFALIRDRKPPEISLPPTHEFVQDIEIYRKMRLYVRDNLSGVSLQSIQCFIDGEIFPFKFDRDRKWIELNLSRGTISKGLHHILIQCTDNSSNQGEFRGLFGFQ